MLSDKTFLSEMPSEIQLEIHPEIFLKSSRRNDFHKHSWGMTPKTPPQQIPARIIDDPPVVSQLFIASLRAGYFDTLSLVIRM